MGAWTAIILAGRRRHENAFALSHGVPFKALIPVGGEPMIARVARALLDSPSVARVVVLTQEPASLFAAAPDWMSREPRIATGEAGPGISSSIAAIAGTEAAPYPILVTTADHALLRPEIVEAFLANAQGVDGAFGVVERAVVERGHPQTRRTWIRFSDGQFSGANLFALNGPASAAATDVWSHVENDRKKALKLLASFGPLILLGALTRTLSLAGAVRRAERKLGIRIRPVRLPYAEAAIDVDKQADLELVERILVDASPAGSP